MVKGPCTGFSNPLQTSNTIQLEAEDRRWVLTFIVKRETTGPPAKVSEF